MARAPRRSTTFHPAADAGRVLSSRLAVLTWLIRQAIVALYPRTPALPGAEDCDLDAFLARFRARAPR